MILEYKKRIIAEFCEKQGLVCIDQKHIFELNQGLYVFDYAFDLNTVWLSVWRKVCVSFSEIEYDISYKIPKKDIIKFSNWRVKHFFSEIHTMLSIDNDTSFALKYGSEEQKQLIQEQIFKAILANESLSYSKYLERLGRKIE